MKAKLYPILLFTILVLLSAFAEDNHYLDSLNGELNHSKNETRRMLYEVEIARIMADKDSAVKLLESVLNRTAEKPEGHVEMAANLVLGHIYLSDKADGDNALPYFSRAMFIANEMQDTLRLAETKVFLGNIYTVKKDSKNADMLFRSAEQLLLNSGRTTGASGDKNYLDQLGFAYHHHAELLMQQERLDNAEQLEKKAIVIFQQTGWTAERARSLITLANIQSKQNNHAGAIQSLNLSLEACTAAEDAPGISYGLSQLALEYSASGNYKMAQQKGDSALLIARGVNASKEKAGAFQALATIHENGNDYKQALHYKDSAAVLTDVILTQQSTEKVASAQEKYKGALEKTRAEKEKIADERNSNIRMAGAAIFLITALVGIIALRRKKHTVRLAKVLGAIGLLMTFELISLVLQPVMEKWTNHSSLYMLLMMGVVAAALVSVHHQIEDRVKVWIHAE